MDQESRHSVKSSVFTAFLKKFVLLPEIHAFYKNCNFLGHRRLRQKLQYVLVGSSLTNVLCNDRKHCPNHKIYF